MRCAFQLFFILLPFYGQKRNGYAKWLRKGKFFFANATQKTICSSVVGSWEKISNLVASKFDIHTGLKLESKLDEIVEGCRKQRRESQKKLFELYGQELFAVCCYYANDYAEAQDVLHDGFIVIFDKIKQLKSHKAVYSWMRRIMVNIALAKHRRNKYLYANEDEFEFKDELTEDMTSGISMEDLERFIEELPPRYKLVFNLYALEGYSHAEISEMLDISVGTSKSNLARARYILQEKVKKLYLEEKTYGKQIKM